MPGNNTTLVPQNGGQGVLSDPHHARETLKMAAQYVRAGRPISDEIRAECVKTAETIMRGEGKTDRDRLRAIEYLSALDAKYAEYLLDLWKAQRVEAGESTENIAHAVTADGLAALSKTLLHEPG